MKKMKYLEKCPIHCRFVYHMTTYTLLSAGSATSLNLYKQTQPKCLSVMPECFSKSCEGLCSLRNSFHFYIFNYPFTSTTQGCGNSHKVLYNVSVELQVSDNRIQL